MIFILSSFIFMFLLGLPFVSLVPSDKFKNKYLISTLFGYGFVAFVATVLYRFGISHKVLLEFLYGMVLVICMGLFFRRKVIVVLLSTHIKTLAYFLLIWLLATIVILLPYWTGGMVFSSHQGWIYDNFSYLGAALTFTYESFKDVLHSSNKFFLHSPLATLGAQELFRKPGIEHLFGLLSEVNKQKMYQFPYLFLAFLSSNGILAATFFITNVFKSSLLRAGMIASALFLGFWGQAYIDFDAWSMDGAMPLLMTVMCYILVMANNVEKNIFLSFKELMPLSILYGFSLYIYPEMVAFYFPAFLAILFFATIRSYQVRTDHFFFIPTLKILMAIGLGLALSVFYYKGTLHFLKWSIKFSATNPYPSTVYGEYIQPLFGQANWFRTLLIEASQYSNSLANSENQKILLTYIFQYIFYKGHVEVIYYAMVDGFYGFFGMYFLTPLVSVPMVIQQIWRGALALVMGYFFWSNGRLYLELIKKYHLFVIATFVLSGLLMVLLYKSNPYGASRGVYYVAPFFIFLFCLPLMNAEKFFISKNFLLILFILSQMGFGLARVGLAGYRSPFLPLPYCFARSHYFPEGKTQYDWNMDRFDEPIKACHRIYVDVPNRWQEFYVTLYLYAKQKDFIKKFPIKRGFWDLTPNSIIGYQKLNGNEDCIFSVSEKTFSDNKTFYELNLRSTVSGRS